MRKFYIADSYIDNSNMVSNKNIQLLFIALVFFLIPQGQAEAQTPQTKAVYSISSDCRLVYAPGVVENLEFPMPPQTAEIYEYHAEYPNTAPGGSASGYQLIWYDWFGLFFGQETYYSGGHTPTTMYVNVSERQPSPANNGDWWINFKHSDGVGGYVDEYLEYTILGDHSCVPYTNTGTPEVDPTITRIIDFNPQTGTTTQNPVFFDVEAYVAPEDLGTVTGVTITLHNIDQNVLILGALSPSDIWLVDEPITQAGNFYFSTTTTIGEGNYRLEACIERNVFNDSSGILGDWAGGIIGIFSDIDTCVSHQFIVGQPSYIGTISQNLWSDTNDFYNGLSATSSEALAGSCNPLGGSFGIRECIVFMFVPDNNQLQLTMQEAREAFLTRIPWGYFTRTYSILSNPATSSLPVFTTNIQIGPGNNETPPTTALTFDVGDMIAGGGAIVDGIRDPINGKSFRDVFEIMVQGLVALAVLLTIVADVGGTHRHSEVSEKRGNNRVT